MLLASAAVSPTLKTCIAVIIIVLRCIGMVGTSTHSIIHVCSFAQETNFSVLSVHGFNMIYTVFSKKVYATYKKLRIKV